MAGSPQVSAMLALSSGTPQLPCPVPGDVSPGSAPARESSAPFPSHGYRAHLEVWLDTLWEPKLLFT